MNVHNFPRGTICVLRQCNGQWEMLAIDQQWTYKEWSGCFTII